MPYPKEVYKGHHYRVVHGPEEYAKAISKGWQDEMPEDSAYIPVSAIVKDQPSLVDKIENEPPVIVKRGPGRPRKEVIQSHGDDLE